MKQFLKLILFTVFTFGLNLFTLAATDGDPNSTMYKTDDPSKLTATAAGATGGTTTTDAQWTNGETVFGCQHDCPKFAEQHSPPNDPRAMNLFNEKISAIQNGKEDQTQ
jgi:hypothetical protein